MDAKKQSRPLVSFCIPTNGIVEWVFPVLDSIYSQNADCELFEVIVSDNGDNGEFKRIMLEYLDKYDNLKYGMSETRGFLNQIECFKMANGELVKFVNHRCILNDGALQKFIDFSLRYKEKKPTIYFMNHNINLPKEINTYSDFDSFINGMSYYSSWSGGLAFWKDKIMPLIMKCNCFDEIFPHLDVIFMEKDNNEFIIDNTVFSTDIDSGHTQKGKYNLFKAFAFHYVEYYERKVNENIISKTTFANVKQANKRLIELLYFQFVVMKEECSYDLSDAEKYISHYYNLHLIKCSMVKRRFKQIIKRLFGK